MNRRIVLLCLVLVASVSGCGSEAPYRKVTSPVTGALTVDGAAPAGEIQIECHPAAGMDAAHPTFSQTASDAAGKFSISTYDAGDGVPAGEYTLTFKMQEFNVISRNYAGPDKLKGRYSDPATSPIKATVKEGEPLDMGVIDLTTK